MVAIQTVDGHYLTAMGAGGWSDANPSNPAFHTDATRIQAWEKFTLVPVTNPYDNRPFGYSIRTTGGYWIWTAVDGGGREVNVLNTLDILPRPPGGVPGHLRAVASDPSAEQSRGLWPDRGWPAADRFYIESEPPPGCAPGGGSLVPSSADSTSVMTFAIRAGSAGWRSPGQ